jgi:AcrR family transcriptional regulator
VFSATELKDDGNMGLRELKKDRTRRAVQGVAMRLFKKHGYAETTVEQISAAAEISTATFYRYFPTKEDVVLNLDYSSFLRNFFVELPEDETLEAIIRALYRNLSVWIEADRELFVTRNRLLNSVPDLQARNGSKRQGMLEFLALLIAPRLGVLPDNSDLRLALAIMVAAESETVFQWATTGGTESLSALLDHAFLKIQFALKIDGRTAHTPKGPGIKVKPAIGTRRKVS